MVAAAKINHGFMPCPHCKNPVALKESTKTGTLQYECQHAKCEMTGYAKKHQGAAGDWLAAVGKPAHRAQDESKQDGAGVTMPPPEKTAPRAAFSFGGLK